MDLDWQNSFHLIKDRGNHLLQTEKWSDCRFLVGTSPNQRILCGHKLILAMASPVFERMFYGNLPDETDPIVIPDVQPDAFKAMLDYMYSDCINIGSFDKACELCYVAKKYMLPHVVQQCTHFLWSDLSPKNACRAYEFAKLFDEPHLMQSSMDIIAANTREVLNDVSFPDIEISTLMIILEQDNLKIDSELDLFNALLRYAKDRGMFCEADVQEIKQQPIQQQQEQQQQQQQQANGVMEISAEPPLDVESLNDANNSNLVEEIKLEPDVSAMIQNDEQNFNDNEPYEVEDSNPHQINDEIVVVDCVVDCVVVPDTDEPIPSTSAAATATTAAMNANLQNLMDPQRHVMDEAMLRQAVKKIRFLTMTPQQFAEGPARSKLLKQHEALAILIKISSPTITDCPMPEGFCSSRCSRNYYESRLSSFRHSVPLNNANGQTNGFIPIEVQPHMSGASLPPSAVHQPQPVTNLICYNSSETDLTNDNRRFFCVRGVNPQFDYRNASVTDCGLTFQVDTNIWITGVQVPTQVLCGELMHSAGFADRYTEVLYAHIQDMQGSRLTYTHCTSRVRYDSLLEISFDRPVYIYRNKTYKVFVVFNKSGWYPMHTCTPEVVCNRVKFRFNVGNPSESIRDGLIRAIVFSTPQEHARTMIE